ncbi:MAG: putative methyltransferase [Dehalococcoidia bacterium]|nr:putative methyltransferase [Dehalococcoidia bacterium]
MGAALWATSARDKRSKDRIASRGPIESPEAAEAYAKVAALPPYRMLTNWLASRALWGVKGGRALDIGCGNGWLALELARRRPDMEVVGMDASDAMVAQAFRNAWDSEARERVSFQRGNGELIPFPSSSFDLVVSTLSLHHFGDLPQVLSEIARVIKPVGRFMLMDLRRDMGVVPWLCLWATTRFLAPKALKEVGEPLTSRDASYTPSEVTAIAWRSPLPPWRVASGPFWLCLENMESP